MSDVAFHTAPPVGGLSCFGFLNHKIWSKRACRRRHITFIDNFLKTAQTQLELAISQFTTRSHVQLELTSSSATVSWLQIMIICPYRYSVFVDSRFLPNNHSNDFQHVNSFWKQDHGSVVHFFCKCQFYRHLLIDLEKLGPNRITEVGWTECCHVLHIHLIGGPSCYYYHHCPTFSSGFRCILEIKFRWVF